MKIKKEYNRNINLGNYETLRVGISVEKEVSDEKMTKEKLAKVSNRLLDVCKEIVDDELKKLKKEERR